MSEKYLRKEKVMKEVMIGHKWYDSDVKWVLTWNVDDVIGDVDIHYRTIILTRKTDAFVVNKDDVIALAKEFNIPIFRGNRNVEEF